MTKSNRGARVKKIGGKNYHLDSLHTSKLSANNRATPMRKRNYSIRVMKNGNDWYVWARR